MKGCALSNARSQIVSKNIDNPKLKEAFDTKFNSLDFGRRVCTAEWADSAISEIQKGAQKYHVRNAFFLSMQPDDQLTDTNCYLIEHDGEFAPISITAYIKQSNGLFISDKVEFCCEHGKFALNQNTDIFNIYDVRFQLRGNEEAKKLIDDFLLPDKADRDYYRTYQSKRIYRENQHAKQIEQALTRQALTR